LGSLGSGPLPAPGTTRGPCGMIAPAPHSAARPRPWQPVHRDPEEPMTTLVALTLAILPGQAAEAGPSPESPVRLAIEAFGYRGVRLDDGPMRRQVDAARADYLRIPNDDLLKGFRLRAGRPSPGADLGGWYSSDIFHVFGQILSGLARLHAATGDPA